MIVELHDATPAAPGEEHGPGGPTHCADLTIDAEYQLEQWLIDLPADRPDVVRVVDRCGRRHWLRVDGRFEREPWPMLEHIERHPWLGCTVVDVLGDGRAAWIVRAVYMQQATVIDAGAVEPWAELESESGRVHATSPLSSLELA